MVRANNCVKNRMLAVALALLLILSPILSIAEPMLPIQITVTWTDGQGQPQSATATGIFYEGYENAFWLYLPPEVMQASDAVITLTDMTGQYVGGFSIDGFPLSALEAEDAGTSLTEHLPVSFMGYDGQGTPIGQFSLYVSTVAQVPDAPTLTPEPQPATVTIRLIDSGTGYELATAQSLTIAAGQTQAYYAPHIEGYTAQPTEITIVVDEFGVPNQQVFDIYYTAAATPEPQPATVTIRLIDSATGQEIATAQSLTVAAGQTQVYYAPHIEGYTAQPTEITIVVDEYGVPNQQVFDIYYTAAATPEPQPATVTIRLIDSATGQEIGTAQSLTVAAGQTQVYYAPHIEGYTAQPTEITIVVDEYGVPNQQVFDIYYTTAATPDPQPATVTVRFINSATGLEIDTAQSLTVAAGQTQTFNAPTLEGYTHQPTEITIVVDEYGVPNQQVFDIYYTAAATPEPQPATVTVRFINSATEQEIGTAQTLTVAAGQTQTFTMPSLDGYTHQPTEITVVVDEYGVPNQQVFDIYYTAVATDEPAPEPTIPPATVTVRFINALNGQELKTPLILTVDAGETKEFPIEAIDGYTHEPREITVVVDASGVPNQDTFDILYTPVVTDAPEPEVTDAPAPEIAIVPVSYRDQFGNPLHSLSFTATQGKENVVSVDWNLINHARYQLTSAESVSISVDGQGVATPLEVVFVFTDLSIDRTATVQVLYQDETGINLAPSTTVTVGTGETAISPHPQKDLSGYDLISPETQTVTLSPEGSLSSPTVTFVYRAKPVPVTPTPTIKPTDTPTPKATAVPTPVADGVALNIWGKISKGGTNFRDRPSTQGKQLAQLKRDTPVFVYQQQTENGEKWYALNYNGKEGFIMADYVALLSREESDALQASLPSPAPIRTLPPVIGATDTPVPATDTPTPATDVPLTQTPEPEPTPDSYRGYALTIVQTDLRTGASSRGEYILASLPQGSLVLVSGQAVVDNVQWDRVEVLSLNQSGYVLDSALRRINQTEAQMYLDQLQRTAPPTSKPILQQQKGYAVTLGSGVAMRNYYSTVSNIVKTIGVSEIVEVLGQESDGDNIWHLTRYQNQYGFIRADQVRMLSPQEEADYLATQRTTPAPVVTPTSQLTSESLSSYGYVNTNNVRLRKEPTTKSAYLKMMGKNAFALVLGSAVDQDGETWYHINQAGMEGYVMGKYFTVLPISQLSGFLKSSDYLNANTQNVTLGSNPTQQMTSWEDYNNVVWKNPALAQTSYEPFSPIITPTPNVESLQTPTPTPSQSPSVSPDASPSPDAPDVTVSIDPLATPETTKTSSFPSGLLAIALLSILGGGGYYAYYLYRRNQRERARRSAQRRQLQQQQASAQGQPRPTATPASGQRVPPTQGTAQYTPYRPQQGQPRPQGPQGQPGVPPTQGTAQYAPYRPQQGQPRPQGPQGQPGGMPPTQGTAQYTPYRPQQGQQGAAPPPQNTMEYKPPQRPAAPPVELKKPPQAPTDQTGGPGPDNPAPPKPRRRGNNQG
jgi:type II secretory pathway pseudopilin PulG